MKWSKVMPEFGSEITYHREDGKVRLIRVINDSITWYQIKINGTCIKTVRTLKEAKMYGEQL